MASVLIASCPDTIADAELLARPVAIGVDRRLRHPEFAGDLLGAEVTVDQSQAFALPRGQKLDWVCGDLLRCAHKMNTLATRVGARLLVMVYSGLGP